MSLGGADGAPVLIVLWWWHSPGYREEYTAEHVRCAVAGIRRNLEQPHRLLLITDRPDEVDFVETHRLWSDCADMMNVSGAHLPSCYRRLKLFSAEVTRELGCQPGDRVASWDLDMVTTGQLDPVFDRPEDFVGWRVPGSKHDVVYNGSLFMFRAEAHCHVWDEFCPVASPGQARAAGYFGSDQGWISYVMQDCQDGWDARDGVYGYRSLGASKALPANARVVSFCGKRKPWHDVVRREAPWVEEHWRL